MKKIGKLIKAEYYMIEASYHREIENKPYIEVKGIIFKDCDKLWNEIEKVFREGCCEVFLERKDNNKWTLLIKRVK